MFRLRTQRLIVTLVLLTGIMALAGCRRDFDVTRLDEMVTASEAAGEAMATPRRSKSNPAAAPADGTTTVPTVVTATPLPTPTRASPENTAVFYTVQPGDTLMAIAAAYGTTTEALIRINQLGNANELSVGQVLQVGLDAEVTGPGEALVPDSELVYGPGYADFDVAAVVAEQPGLLASYTEDVSGRSLTGAEIVQLVAQQYSVGPRVVLALLELRGEWLSNPDPSPTARLQPMGYNRGEAWNGLYFQLATAANALNAGFYGWLDDTLWLVQTANGTYIQYSTDLNAGTAGVQKMVADTASTYDTWLTDLRRFQEIYVSLFGDPFDYAVEPLLSPETTNPELVLPWAKGETWYFTGGPHPGWGTLGPFSAVDFVTDEEGIGCAISKRWVTASAPGRIEMSDGGMVLQDLDSDGFVGTGWVVQYLHIATEERVEEGSELQVGDRIGHPSCEGGISDATHLHFARRLNGVWIAADDPWLPMRLSGWQPVSTDTAYDGTLERNGEVRETCMCWEAVNAVTHE